MSYLLRDIAVAMFTCNFGIADMLCSENNNYIALDKIFFKSKIIGIFLIFPQKHICYEYSIEAPHQDASIEYPQHTFSWRNKKNIYLIPTLI